MSDFTSFREAVAVAARAGVALSLSSDDPASWLVASDALEDARGPCPEADGFRIIADRLRDKRGLVLCFGRYARPELAGDWYPHPLSAVGISAEWKWLDRPEGMRGTAMEFFERRRVHIHGQDDGGYSLSPALLQREPELALAYFATLGGFS